MPVNRLIARVRRRLDRQEGFTIIELVVAMAVLMIALLSLARTASVAFTDISFSRQRQTGNQIANQLLEQIRALPYETVKKGLSSSDLTGDARIVNCSGTYRYLTCSGEKLVHTAGAATATPLVPHRGSYGPPLYGNTYSWSTYVTEAASAPPKGAYRVTVVVDWNPTSRGGARTEVNLQTLVFSPVGCTDPATHPFGGKCEAYYYSTAATGGGSLEVTGTFDDGVAFDWMRGGMLSQTADLQLEQIYRVEGDVVLPSIVKSEGGIETSYTNGVSTAADNDPATPSTTYESQSVGPQSGNTATISDAEYSMSMTLGGSDQGQSISTTSAGGSNGCNLQIDARPCGYVEGRQAGSLTHTLDVSEAGAATVASVGTSGTLVTTYTRRYRPVAAENGLVREQISWTLPEIRIGGLPANVPVPHSSWAGYWVRLTGFTATATAEAGTGTVAPAVTISGGTVQHWNGNGYTNTAVTASGATITPVEVHEGTNGSVKNDVDISGTVTIEPSTTTSAGTGTTRTIAGATIGSPFLVEMEYDVEHDEPSNDEDRRADLHLVFSAGQAVLSTTYKP
jgi:type II secretory pathway pseudopilin PulG